MIVLDTNVVSELMRAAPGAAVLAWIDDQPSSSLFLTAMAEAEIRFGLAVLPAGKRSDGLVKAAGRLFEEILGGRILPFDSEAAGAIAAARRASGRPISQFDCQIAAIASSRGATVATRNVSDFEGCGIETVNPWRSSSAA
jgi:toxin FitB